jgi:hypothetical protein
LQPLNRHSFRAVCLCRRAFSHANCWPHCSCSRRWYALAGLVWATTCCPSYAALGKRTRQACSCQSCRRRQPPQRAYSSCWLLPPPMHSGPCWACSRSPFVSVTRTASSWAVS